MPNQPSVAFVVDRAEADKYDTRVAFAEADPAPTVVTPSTAVRSYLRTFGAVAIVAYLDGSIGCTKDIGRPLRSTPIACWWAPNAALALEVVRQCRAEESTDICGTARGLNVQLTAHSTAVTNAERSLAVLDARIEEARRRGYLKVFNAKYAQLRQAARRQGCGFMAYNVAVHRLRRELMRCAAGSIDGSIVDRALNGDASGDERLPKTAHVQLLPPGERT
jgi:hypothetical protein